jgi:hypothetical protein
MNITTADRIIKERLNSGQLSASQAAHMHKMIRRTGDYGNRWSWQKQSMMRASLIKQLGEI